MVIILSVSELVVILEKRTVSLAPFERFFSRFQSILALYTLPIRKIVYNIDSESYKKL